MTLKHSSVLKFFNTLQNSQVSNLLFFFFNPVPHIDLDTSERSDVDNRLWKFKNKWVQWSMGVFLTEVSKGERC